MPRPDRSNALDHLVVLMFENRSFDNLLGRLYEPGEVASFDGVTGKDLSNPIPDWAADQGPGDGVVPYTVATDMNMPSPDLTQDVDVTRADGAALLSELAGDMFVRLHDGLAAAWRFIRRMAASGCAVARRCEAPAC
jgi:hypothetical protein